MGRKSRSEEAKTAIAGYRERLLAERRLLGGIAMLFDCVNLVYEGNDEISRTYCDEFLANLRIGEENARQAEVLIAQAEATPAKASALLAMPPDVLSGCGEAASLRDRATRLLSAFEALFPGRTYAGDLAPDEVLRLLDAALVC